jgi:hypothetical protein
MKNITVPLDIARATFDIAVGSMDFGSGFLDDEEVKQLRDFAVRIGIDPMLATPETFRLKYQHAYEPDRSEWHWEYPDPRNWASGIRVEGPYPDRCHWCRMERAHEVHQA